MTITEFTLLDSEADDEWLVARFLPVKVVHLLESVYHSNDPVLESTLGAKSWNDRSKRLIAFFPNVHLPRTVVKPSSNAPKFDISGLKETIYTRRINSSQLADE